VARGGQFTWRLTIEAEGLGEGAAEMRGVRKTRAVGSGGQVLPARCGQRRQLEAVMLLEAANPHAETFREQVNEA